MAVLISLVVVSLCGFGDPRKDKPTGTLPSTCLRLPECFCTSVCVFPSPQMRRLDTQTSKSFPRSQIPKPRRAQPRAAPLRRSPLRLRGAPAGAAAAAAPRRGPRDTNRTENPEVDPVWKTRVPPPKGGKKKNGCPQKEREAQIQVAPLRNPAVGSR